MTDARTPAELEHVAQVAAAAVAWLRQNELRRLSALLRPHLVRTHARFTRQQLDEAYRRAGTRNPRTAAKEAAHG